MDPRYTHPEGPEIAALLELAGEQQGRQILRALGTPGALGAFERHCATSYARRLMAGGLSRRSTAFKVSARYELSVKSAYRRIDDAMALGPFGTKPAAF